MFPQSRTDGTETQGLNARKDELRLEAPVRTGVTPGIMYAADTERRAFVEAAAAAALGTRRGTGSAVIASEAVASVWALAPPHLVRGWCHHVPQCATVAFDIYTEPGNEYEEQQGSGSMPDDQYKQNDYGDDTTPQKGVEKKEIDYSFDEDALQEELITPVNSIGTGPAIPASFRSTSEYEPEPRLDDECLFVAPKLGGYLHHDVNSQQREPRANSASCARGLPGRPRAGIGHARSQKGRPPDSPGDVSTSTCASFVSAPASPDMSSPADTDVSVDGMSCAEQSDFRDDANHKFAVSAVQREAESAGRSEQSDFRDGANHKYDVTAEHRETHRRISDVPQPVSSSSVMPPSSRPSVDLRYESFPRVSPPRQERPTTTAMLIGDDTESPGPSEPDRDKFMRLSAFAESNSVVLSQEDSRFMMLYATSALR